MNTVQAKTNKAKTVIDNISGICICCMEELQIHLVLILERFILVAQHTLHTKWYCSDSR